MRARIGTASGSVLLPEGILNHGAPVNQEGPFSRLGPSRQLDEEGKLENQPQFLPSLFFSEFGEKRQGYDQVVASHS